MPDIPSTVIVVLCVAALAACWIDAVVGGGLLLLGGTGSGWRERGTRVARAM